jgi:hypothetical protein
MSNLTREYGDLVVTVTKTFEWRWDDRGSGANRNGGFWHAKAQGGLRPLGSTAVAGYSGVDGQRGILLVGDNPSKRPQGKGAAVVPPIDYQALWNDKGSGANRDGSFWRPVAPVGYVSLGDVVWGGYGKPNLEQVWCVRADLTSDGAFQSSSIWDDKGSGANADGSFWEILPRSVNLGGSESIPMLAGTFRVNSGYGRPEPSIARVPVLKVPKQVQKFVAPVPKITKDNIPESRETFNETEVGSITLPFLCFFDATDRPSLDYIQNPFCTVSKTIAWIAAGKYANDTGNDATESTEIKTGVSQTKTTEITHSAGVQVSSEYGIGLAKFSITLNYQFTFSQSNSFTEYKEETKTKSFTVGAHSVVIAWAKHVWIKGTRADGSQLSGEISFDANEDVYLSGTSLL